MGRRSRLQELDLTLEDITRAYTEFQTAEAVGRHFGISERTIRKYLKEAQVEMPKGRRKGDSFNHFSRFAQWLKKHPGYPLPRRVKEIVEVTGLDPNDIKTYLYRRRKAVQVFAESLPDLTQFNLLLEDTKGRKIPSKAIRFYIVSMDRYTLHIIVRAMLKNNRPYMFIYTVEELKALLKEAKHLEREPQELAGVLHRTMPGLSEPNSGSEDPDTYPPRGNSAKPLSYSEAETPTSTLESH